MLWMRAWGRAGQGGEGALGDGVAGEHDVFDAGEGVAGLGGRVLEESEGHGDGLDDVDLVVQDQVAQVAAVGGQGGVDEDHASAAGEGGPHVEEAEVEVEGGVVQDGAACCDAEGVAGPAGEPVDGVQAQRDDLGEAGGSGGGEHEGHFGGLGGRERPGGDLGVGGDAGALPVGGQDGGAAGLGEEVGQEGVGEGRGGEQQGASGEQAGQDEGEGGG